LLIFTPIKGRVEHDRCMGTIRVTTSTGAVVDEPSTAELVALIDEVGRAGRGAFLIVEDAGDRSRQTYVQLLVDRLGFLIESRSWRRVHRARTTDAHRAARMIGAWSARHARVDALLAGA
jgi:hypothetical protein